MKNPILKNRTFLGITIAIFLILIIWVLYVNTNIFSYLLPRTLRAYSSRINPNEAYYIQPFGEMDPETLAYIQEFLQSDSGRSVIVLDPVEIPDDARGRSKQANADVLFSYLREVSMKHENVFRLIGLTMEDIYVDDMNFVFGISGFFQKCVIISFYRLRPQYRLLGFVELSSGELKLYRTRIRKIIRHELGHTFSLWHCSNPYCVMSYANTVEEQDSEGEYYCPVCAHNLRKGSSFK